MGSLQIHHLAEQAAIATWENVSINVWVGAPSAQLLLLLRKVTRTHVVAHPRGVVSMTVLTRGGAGLNVGKEERALSEELAREFGSTTRAIAHVILGNGFFMGAVRTYLAGVALASRAEYQTKVFDSVEQGATWLSPLAGSPTGGALPDQALLQATQEVMAQVKLLPR